MRLTASSQDAARLLFSEYDAQSKVRVEAEKKLVAESHRHTITRTLETFPRATDRFASRSSSRSW